MHTGMMFLSLRGWPPERSCDAVLLRRMDATAGDAVELIMIARRMIAWAIAYSVALQAMLSGFAVPALTASPAGEICTPAGNAAPAAPAPHPMRSDCLACPAMCGAGLAPARTAATAGQTPTARAESHPIRAIAPIAPRLLPPSRAPPAA